MEELAGFARLVIIGVENGDESSSIKGDKIAIPGHRKREIKREDKELEFRPECPALEVYLRGMVRKQLSP